MYAIRSRLVEGLHLASLAAKLPTDSEPLAWTDGPDGALKFSTGADAGLWLESYARRSDYAAAVADALEVVDIGGGQVWLGGGAGLAFPREAGR